MPKGRIIFLNGTSSSGKTTIAKVLQDTLPDPYMLVSVDSFFDLYPERFWNPAQQEDPLALRRLVPAVVSGFHRTVAVLAKAGNNLIVDHVLQEQGWLAECVQRWAGLDVLFVGIRCPLDVLELREAERGDRDPGTARYQFCRVHAHGLYDVEVDTSALDVEECVAEVVDALERAHIPRAFPQLRLHAQGIAAGFDALNRQPATSGHVMNRDAYRKAYFVDPPPEPRFRFTGSFGATLYFEDFCAAVAFYENVLGPPSYVEGKGTRGWPIGGGWLTLLQGGDGNPHNVEITLELETAKEAEALQRAFIAAGATGPAPSDQLMYRPVRACPVVDPSGLEIMIIGPLPDGERNGSE